MAVAEEYYSADDLAESAELFGDPEYTTEASIDAGNNGITWLSQYALKEAQYIDRPLLQAATFHLLGGRPGVGKGAICSWWVARCTTGDMYGDPRRVLWLSSEDDPEIDLGPRVEAAGGNRSLVGLIPHTFQLPDSIAWLRETVSNYTNVGLVLIDPLSNHTGRAKTDNEEEVRNALMPLGIMAGELNVPILGVRHITTKEAKGGALGHILGSTAWIGVPRVVIAAVKDPVTPSVVHVRAIKGNRVSTSDAGRQYELEGFTLPGFAESVVVAHNAGVSNADIDVLLAGESETKSQKAEAAIIEILRQNPGGVEPKTLDYMVAQSSGLQVSTLKKVRTTMKESGLIHFQPDRDEYGKAVAWRVLLAPPLMLPNEAAPRAGGQVENALLSFAGISSTEATTQADLEARSSDLQGDLNVTPHEQAITTTTHSEPPPPREDEPTWADVEAAALELQHRTGKYGHPLSEVIALAREEDPSPDHQTQAGNTTEKSGSPDSHAGVTERLSGPTSAASTDSPTSTSHGVENDAPPAPKRLRGERLQSPTERASTASDAPGNTPNVTDENDWMAGL